NERNANSGIVVGITPDDYPGHSLAGIDFQRRLEANAFKLGGENYAAPVQLVGDFLLKRPSSALGNVYPSYTPGVHLGDLSSSLPDYAIAAIREAIPAFDKKIKGFAMADAVLTAVETRTSSPIRIKRNEYYQSLNVKGLYPAGEGAGYAGDILSAAVDGIKVAEAVALNILSSSVK
ncbi:MAG: NAD(P)/FAD-dependent oxidoreductase, partial [Methylobacter sp.]